MGPKSHGRFREAQKEQEMQVGTNPGMGMGQIQPPGYGPQAKSSMLPFTRATHSGYLFLTHSHRKGQTLAETHTHPASQDSGLDPDRQPLGIATKWVRPLGVGTPLFGCCCCRFTETTRKTSMSF